MKYYSAIKKSEIMPFASIPCGGGCSPTLRNQGGTAEGEGLFSTFPSTSPSSLQGIRGTGG